MTHTMEAGAKAEAEANKTEKTADFMVQLEYTDGKSDRRCVQPKQEGSVSTMLSSLDREIPRFNQGGANVTTGLL